MIETILGGSGKDSHGDLDGNFTAYPLQGDYRENNTMGLSVELGDNLYMLSGTGTTALWRINPFTFEFEDISRFSKSYNLRSMNLVGWNGKLYTTSGRSILELDPLGIDEERVAGTATVDIGGNMSLLDGITYDTYASSYKNTTTYRFNQIDVITGEELTAYSTTKTLGYTNHNGSCFVWSSEVYHLSVNKSYISRFDEASGRFVQYSTNIFPNTNDGGRYPVVLGDFLYYVKYFGGSNQTTYLVKHNMVTKERELLKIKERGTGREIDFGYSTLVASETLGGMVMFTADQGASDFRNMALVFN